MDRKAYIDNLKRTNLYPQKIQARERQLDVLIEDQKDNTIKTITELFVQTNEIQNMQPGKARDLAILRLAITAELDAVNLYMCFVDLLSDEDATKVMVDVANEEKTHAGEFKKIMETIDSNYEKFEREGRKEVETLIGE